MANEQLLQTAQKNLETLGNALGKKVGAEPKAVTFPKTQTRVPNLRISKTVSGLPSAR